MVTTVLLPAIRRSTPPAEQYRLFERIEHRFAAQARWSTQLVGASGLAMLWLTDSWARLINTGWLHLMLAVYAVFTLMLFVLEPLLIHRLLAGWARQNPRWPCAACSACTGCYWPSAWRRWGLVWWARMAAGNWAEPRIAFSAWRYGLLRVANKTQRSGPG